MNSEELERIGSLIEFHRSEHKNYAARGGQCDNPKAAEWLNEMASRHAKWAEDIERILRGDQSKGGAIGNA